MADVNRACYRRRPLKVEVPINYGAVDFKVARFDVDAGVRFDLTHGSESSDGETTQR